MSSNLNSSHDLEAANFLDLWREKLFLGQEFLTWLWIISEINGNFLPLKAARAWNNSSAAAPGPGETPAVELWVESRLTLESGGGVDRQMVTCQAPESQWAEAHTALKRGKKLTRAKIKVLVDEKEWSFVLGADTLTPQSVKFPPTFGAAEEEEDSASGQFLERVALLGELVAIIEGLFRQFLEVRLSSDWEFSELPKLNKWLAAQK